MAGRPCRRGGGCGRSAAGPPAGPAVGSAGGQAGGRGGAATGGGDLGAGGAALGVGGADLDRDRLHQSRPGSGSAGLGLSTPGWPLPPGHGSAGGHVAGAVHCWDGGGCLDRSPRAGGGEPLVLSEQPAGAAASPGAAQGARQRLL